MGFLVVSGKVRERERKTPPCVFHYLCIAHCYRSFTDEATFGADRVHLDLELELHELIKGSVGLGSVMEKKGTKRICVSCC